VQLVTFVTPDGREAVGVHEAGTIREAAAAGGLLGAFEAGLETLADRGASYPLDTVRLLAPLPRPNRIFALAGNFADHILEGGERVRRREGSTPRVFSKPPSCVIGPEAGIRIPSISTTVDHEIELAVVVGRRAARIRREDVASVVAGYAVFNDVSARYLTFEDRDEAAADDAWYDFINGKWCDTFGPLGPYLVTADEVPDPGALAMELRVNGEVRQSGSTAQMIFDVGDALAFISRICELAPGDVIAMGTPAGTAIGTGKYLVPGDVVEATIQGLGTLRNPVEA